MYLKIWEPQSHYQDGLESEDILNFFSIRLRHDCNLVIGTRPMHVITHSLLMQMVLSWIQFTYLATVTTIGITHELEALSFFFLWGYFHQGFFLDGSNNRNLIQTQEATLYSELLFQVQQKKIVNHIYMGFPNDYFQNYLVKKLVSMK